MKELLKKYAGLLAVIAFLNAPAWAQTVTYALGDLAFRNAATPPALGGTTPAAAAFTTISATGQITSTLSTGTAPFVVASTTNVANLNASTLTGSATGTSGATIPLLNGTNTWSGVQTVSLSSENPFLVETSRNVGNQRILRVFQNSGTSAVGGGGITIENSGTAADTRNWGFSTNNLVSGDLTILQSNAALGNPLSAGTVRLWLNLAGELITGSTSDAGAFQIQSTGAILSTTKMRANTGFNFNGTDGITVTCTVIPTGITVQGGIITAVTGGTCV